MQIKIQITAADIRKALDRHSKGFTLESPLSVALERQGHKGAVHSPSDSYPAMWAYNAAGTHILKIQLSKRAMLALRMWRKRQISWETTYLVSAAVAMEEPDFPGYEK